MKNIFLIGLLGFLLSGCDRGIICDCFDESDDAILFTFDTNATSQGFKPDEIDTFFIYQLAKNQSNVLDSAMFVYDSEREHYKRREPSADCSYGKGFVLNHGCPFYNGLYQNYDYLISLPELKTYHINNLEIEGYSSGECGCYTNTKKLVTVNGVNYDLTDTDPFHNPIVLTK